ncbi:MAG TPA: oligopeptide:H+ symporter [Polyangiaceae bacterium]|nr:oligopeptide:H+ symporter [Polyangiaceae bacterium]
MVTKAAPHPRGLYLLFFTEMWERFSYYGMRALLMTYMLNYLLWQPERASGVYKWYTSLVYLTPLLGGLIADRLLGLRNSIVIGGILMAIGHFLMAFEALPFFYAALGFLIAGNGFFKPNISTMVGKMYPKGDNRRDGAFTIFYMGINLGAFLSPLVCAWLKQHYSFHYGFAAAGIGMCVGLTVFLVGQKRVLADIVAAEVAEKSAKAEAEDAAKEEAANEQPTGSAYRDGKPDAAADAAEGADGARGFAGGLAMVYPFVMILAALGIAGMYVAMFLSGQAKGTALIMPVAFGGVFVTMAVILLRLKGKEGDKSKVIFMLFCFAVLFWMAFEQAGNALSIWADQHTVLKVGTFEYPAEYFQSVNAVLIFILAPLFTMFWIKVWNPSTPVKMFVALLFMTASFVAMVAGAGSENSRETRVKLAGPVPAGVDVSKLDAGRLRFEGGELVVKGVLPIFGRNGAIAAAVPESYAKFVDGLEERTKGATKAAPVTIELTSLPEYFEPLSAKGAKDAKDGEVNGVSELVGATVDADGKVTPAPGAKIVFHFTAQVDENSKVSVLQCAAPPAWKAAVVELAKASQDSRVSGMWLFLSYLLATLGELCLSPVGLSMVTKLAPARFGSLFMGVWLLSSSVAQYVGGSIGESWGKVTPVSYFQLFVVISILGAGVLFVFSRPIRKLMHEVT